MAICLKKHTRTIFVRLPEDGEQVTEQEQETNEEDQVTEVFFCDSSY